MQTDKHRADRQAGSDENRHTKRKTNRQDIHGQTYRHHIHIDRQAHRQTDRQACKQTDRHADKQTDRQALIHTDRQANKQIERQAHNHIRRWYLERRIVKA